jgi:hypothetical protein
VAKDGTGGLVVRSGYDIDKRCLHIVVASKTFVIPFDESLRVNLRLFMMHLFSLLDSLFVFVHETVD